MTHPPAQRARPVPLLDTAAATRMSDDALALQLDTTTRDAIESTTARLTEQVRAFDAALPRDSVAARGDHEEVRNLLARAPKNGAVTFSVHAYMRDLARMLRRLIFQYEAQQVRREPKEGGEEGGGISTQPKPAAPSRTGTSSCGCAHPHRRRWVRLTTSGGC
ncbi:hypothetical protein [Streptomyces sp. NPDC006134]|uniref:hypothetical protein n=1 Tax=Streptomyces sp. NPDC006134 TaxID=3154467 RepID=UPI0033C9E182